MSTIRVTRNAQVAAEIRAEMARQQMPGRRLAELVRMPNSTVARYVRGETEMSLDDIETFASALGLTTVDLIARAYNAPTPTAPPSGGISTPEMAQNRPVRRQGLEPRTRWLKGRTGTLTPSTALSGGLPLDHAA